HTNSAPACRTADCTRPHGGSAWNGSESWAGEGRLRYVVTACIQSRHERVKQVFARGEHGRARGANQQVPDVVVMVSHHATSCPMDAARCSRPRCNCVLMVPSETPSVAA